MKKYLSFLIPPMLILSGCNSSLERESEELKRKISLLQKENTELMRLAEEQAAEARKAMNQAILAKQKTQELLKSCEEKLKKKTD
jgi:hypothetical protein